jgi:hypothetical protein
MVSRFLCLMLCVATCLSAKEPNPSKHPTKKVKAHYAGTRKQPPKEKSVRKKRSTIKNKWVASKTHPKVNLKTAESQIEAAPEQIEELPYFQRTSYPVIAAPAQKQQHLSLDRLEDQIQELQQEIEDAFPKTGFQAPRGHVYVTADWLYWRARQEGMEYAIGRSIQFDYTSGFRVGLGVHLPKEGWDIYANYTQITPEHSNNFHGQTFPLFLYQATQFVQDSHAHWKIAFQSVDLELGRAYFLSSSLSFRPYFGLKGGWIDQHAKIVYRGGFIPEGQAFSIHLKNDFKGAGPRVGLQLYWHLGAGFSLFSDMAAAFLIGPLNNHQTQEQLNGTEPIRWKIHQHLVSPNLQLVAALNWDRNFRQERCHFGLSAGFETQMYWSQNQIERFTSEETPNYLRTDGDLAFYGLTLRGRFDF